MTKVDVEKIAQEANETANAARDKVSAAGARVADTVKDGALSFKDKAEVIGRDVCNYVNENPWKAVGIGIAAGMLLTTLLNARK